MERGRAGHCGSIRLGLNTAGNLSPQQFRPATWAFMFNKLFQTDDPRVDHLKPARNTTPARRTTPANPAWVGCQGALGVKRGGKWLSQFRQETDSTLPDDDLSTQVQCSIGATFSSAFSTAEHFVRILLHLCVARRKDEKALLQPGG